MLVKVVKVYIHEYNSVSLLFLLCLPCLISLFLFFKIQTPYNRNQRKEVGSGVAAFGISEVKIG